MDTVARSTIVIRVLAAAAAAAGGGGTCQSRHVIVFCLRSEVKI